MDEAMQHMLGIIMGTMSCQGKNLSRRTETLVWFGFPLGKMEVMFTIRFPLGSL